jgi:hypothetical protein
MTAARLGLERDYATLGGGDRDKFEIHLKNVLSRSVNRLLQTNCGVFSVRAHDRSLRNLYYSGTSAHYR